MPADQNTRGKLDSRIGFQFLLTELQSAFTFAGLAATGDPRAPDEIEFDKQNAHKAYDTVIRLRDRVALDDSQNAKLDSELKRVKEVLENLDKNPPRLRKFGA